jgi:hypothetical protein
MSESQMAQMGQMTLISVITVNSPVYKVFLLSNRIRKKSSVQASTFE